jgi:tripartite-type tricarboxylate transporter receptor subunit TctC
MAIFRRLTLTLVACALHWSVTDFTAHADDEMPKSINLYIGSGPGGGYDYYGRLAARHLGKHLPGAPSITPQNMPGAGSITAANYVYTVAPKDGSALGIVSPSVSLIEGRNSPGVRFHAARFNWIGRLASIANVSVAWHTSSAKSIDDVKKREMLIGGISINSPLSMLPRALNDYAGTQFKLVPGYADSNSTMLAMERGEVEGTTVSWSTIKTQRPAWLTDSKITILVQYSLTRHPDLKGVPTAIEVASGERERELLSMYVSAADVGYAIFAPPDVANARVQALRAGFDKMVTSEALLAEVAKAQTDFDPASGQRLQDLLTSEAGKFGLLRAARATSKP